MRTKQQARSFKETGLGIAVAMKRRDPVFPSYSFEDKQVTTKGFAETYSDKERVQGYLDSLGSEFIRNHLLKKLQDPEWTNTVCELFPKDEFPLPKEKKKRNKKDKSIDMSLDRFQDSNLSIAVVNQLQRLGGMITIRPPRKYLGHPIPSPIQSFCDILWLYGRNFFVPKYNAEVEFSKEFLIEEWSEYKFLTDNKDAILIGEGNVLVAARMKDKQQDIFDFNVYLLDDNAKETYEGPYKISEFLRNCEKCTTNFFEL